MKSARRLAGLAVGFLLLPGCGVSYDVELLTAIEARWMCDVQRYTFDEIGDIEAELNSRLSGNGVTAEQYRAFKDDLTKQAELRDAVSVDLAAYCDTGG